MLKKKFLVILALAQSINAIAALSNEQMELQVESIGTNSDAIPAVSAESYHRALSYEKFNLTMEDRAKRETNILVEKIKTQVALVYNNVLTETGDPELARTAVKAKIETDLKLVAPELRDNIEAISLRALDATQNGELSIETSAPAIESDMLKITTTQSNFLNSGFIKFSAGSMMSLKSVQLPPAPTNVTKGNATEYKTGKELVEALVSSEASIYGGNFSSSMGVSTGKSTTIGASVSYRVNVNFLGTNLNAGPSISFSRTYSTSAFISGDDLKPMMTKDGQFDFYLRDQSGKIIEKNGIPQKRFITFSCSANLGFQTNYDGSGGFSVVGIGGSTSISRNYSSSVNINSRTVALPEYLEGKSVTLSSLGQICNKEFMNVKLMNNMTLKDSLNVMMKDMIASLVFTHPNTKCVLDKHCEGWFNKNIRPIAGPTAVPRCLEESREHFMACYARGLSGAKCAVYQNKKLVSDGTNEFSCDRGLHCRQVKEYGWFKNYQMFQYAEGRCTK